MILLKVFMNIITLFTACFAYLTGAIPTGYLIARLKGIADIRKYGSGNIGATNVARALGKHYFLLIFLLDAGKAYLFIRIIKNCFDSNYLCLFAAILLFGNGCSIFLQGRGGKGVATLFGLLLALHKSTTIILFGVWCLLLFITKTVGIASVGAALSLPLCAYRTDDTAFILWSLYAALWIVYTHRSNIKAYWNQY